MRRPALSILDRALTATLGILVVAMVLSISAEIVLCAIVQPAASRLLSGLEEDAVGEAGAGRAPSPSATARLLEGVVGAVSELSAPVNTASQTLLVWVGILGSALALRLRAHMGVDALVRLYPRRLRRILDRISTLLIAAFSLAVLVVGGYAVCERAFSSGSKMPGLAALNQGWFYLVLVLTGILNLIYCAAHFASPRVAGDEGSSAEDEAARAGENEAAGADGAAE